MINEICRYIDENKENILRDCSNIIKIPSVSNNTNDVRKCLNFALALGKEYGFNTYKTKKSDVGVIEYGEGDELDYCHQENERTKIYNTYLFNVLTDDTI